MSICGPIAAAVPPTLIPHWIRCPTGLAPPRAWPAWRSIPGTWRNRAGAVVPCWVVSYVGAVGLRLRGPGEGAWPGRPGHAGIWSRWPVRPSRPVRSCCAPPVKPHA